VFYTWDHASTVTRELSVQLRFRAPLHTNERKYDFIAFLSIVAKNFQSKSIYLAHFALCTFTFTPGMACPDNLLSKQSINSEPEY
jgi:hypothetical protein